MRTLSILFAVSFALPLAAQETWPIADQKIRGNVRPARLIAKLGDHGSSEMVFHKSGDYLFVKRYIGNQCKIVTIRSADGEIHNETSLPKDFSSIDPLRLSSDGEFLLFGPVPHGREMVIYKTADFFSSSLAKPHRSIVVNARMKVKVNYPFVRFVGMVRDERAFFVERLPSSSRTKLSVLDIKAETFTEVDIATLYKGVEGKDVRFGWQLRDDVLEVRRFYNESRNVRGKDWSPDLGVSTTDLASCKYTTGPRAVFSIGQATKLPLTPYTSSPDGKHFIGVSSKARVTNRPKRKPWRYETTAIYNVPDEPSYSDSNNAFWLRRQLCVPNSNFKTRIGIPANWIGSDIFISNSASTYKKGGHSIRFYAADDGRLLQTIDLKSQHAATVGNVSPCGRYVVVSPSLGRNTGEQLWQTGLGKPSSPSATR